MMRLPVSHLDELPPRQVVGLVVQAFVQVVGGGTGGSARAAVLGVGGHEHSVAVLLLARVALGVGEARVLVA